MLQRAVEDEDEDEVAAVLGRARDERAPAAPGSHNGTRPKPIQTAAGELTVAMPQVRGTAERFVRRVIPATTPVIRPRPLAALIPGGSVRGRSDRDSERLVQAAGLGAVSTRTAPPAGSAGSSGIATAPAGTGAWPRCTSWRCCWTPSPCRRGRGARRKG